MSKRPTLDDLLREQDEFIGPPEPPQGPKMQRKLTEADDIYVDMLVTVRIVESAIEVDQPIDASRLPDRILEILVGSPRNRPLIVNGRRHYDIRDVIVALDTLADRRFDM